MITKSNQLIVGQINPFVYIFTPYSYEVPIDWNWVIYIPSGGEEKSDHSYGLRRWKSEKLNLKGHKL